MSQLKQMLLRVATARPITRALRLAMADRASIFMLHRFHNPDAGVEGTDPRCLRRNLAYLRAEKYELISLADLFRRLREGRPLRRAIAFTIDDGYLDQAMVAGPIFADFDAPVTTFVTSGFLDGLIWFWWDQIEYILRRTDRKELTVPLGGREVSYRWSDERSRRAAQLDFTERCKRVPDAEKHRAIRNLACVAEVELPSAPPPEYAPMSWADARACERRGMTFGPHTVTHPILSRTTGDRAFREIAESWERVQRELSVPVSIFCYPNGGRGDFGEREIGILQRLGLRGAVVGMPGYASSSEFRRDVDGPFLVPRFAFPDQLPVLVQYASGLEHVKNLFRATEAAP